MKDNLEETKLHDHEHDHEKHPHHHTQPVDAPPAGNAANAAKAADDTGESDNLIAAKQTADDPTGAGEGGSGIAATNPEIEIPDQPAPPKHNPTHERHVTTE
jgi:hypothetical protein